MKSRWLSLVAALAGPMVAGFIGRPIATPVWREVRRHEPGAPAGGLPAGRGPAAFVVLLAGFRGVAADLAWVRGHVLWERRDAPGTLEMIRLATALDPRPLAFWINGARIMAYDLPAWLAEDSAAGGSPSAAASRQVEVEQAQLALAWLEEARRHHPASADLLIEQADICLTCLHDREAAAVKYRGAAGQPDAPYYAARLYAWLLCQSGRKAEALDWLVHLHPLLPVDDDAAAADFVRQRIVELEEDLGIPAAARYRPGKA